jgi:DNA-dependent RNA polymerase auxiliary subunit epsilon
LCCLKNQLAKSLLYADKGDKTMIYKVYYQETKVRNPKREETKSLYIEAKSDVDARQRVEENTPYNIEFVQLLEGSHLEYEKENADFSLVEF